MPKFFVKSSQIDNNQIFIEGLDFKHISNVLRAKVGEKIHVCNEETSQNYVCEIFQFEKNRIITNIIEEIANESEMNIEIHILQGIPKFDKMETIIQKCVELGVKSIIPIQMDRSVVKLDKKNEIKKNERWNKIAESAAKQCGRDIIPKVEKIIKTDEIKEKLNEFDVLIVTYENEKENSIKRVLQELKKKNEKMKIAIVVGPEGGIAIREIEYFKELDAKIVTIGKRILRTETVAPAISSMVMYEFDL